MDIIIGSILFIFLLAWVSFLGAQFYNIIFRSYAPFVSTRPRVIKKILDELELKDGATVFELGCGRAGFLGAVAKKYPKADLIGVEGAFWPYITARIQHSIKKNKIKIIKKNLFAVDLNQANVIYLYLNQKTIYELEKKIKKECSSGTTVITYHFPFPSWHPAKVVPIDEGREKIYFYKV